MLGLAPKLVRVPLIAKNIDFAIFSKLRLIAYGDKLPELVILVMFELLIRVENKFANTRLARDNRIRDTAIWESFFCFFINA